MNFKLMIALGTVGFVSQFNLHLALGDDVAKLEERIAATRARIKTIVIRSQIRELLKESPLQSGAGIDGFVATTKAQRDHALAALEAGDERKTAEINRKYEERLAMADDLEKAHRQNRDVSIARNHWIDFASGRHRVEDKDLRPLDEIIVAEEMDESIRPMLSRTVTVFADSQHSTKLVHEADQLAVVGATETFNADKALLTIGILPAWIFTDDFRISTEYSTNEKRGYSVTYLPDGYIVARFEIDESLDATLISWKTFGRGDSLRQSIEFQDHRNVQGLWLAHRTINTKALYGMSDFYTAIVEIQSAEVGIPILDEMFEIPDGFRVQDTTTAAKGQ